MIAPSTSLFRVSLAVLSLTVSASNLLAQPWTEQGPGPIRNGQAEGIPNRPVSGAVNAIAVAPGDGNTVYVAAVNGGVWKTTNALAATPTWVPLTDLQLPALSINSLAISPLDPNTLYAGTGSTSSDGFDGSPGFGVAKSTDGGNTWSVLAGTTFTGRRINSIVPTMLTTGQGQVVLASTLFDRGGVYRSTDGGATFTRISGGSGLPNAGVSSLVADPADSNRFYAGVPTNYLTSGTPGGYRSDDGGVTWNPVNTGLNVTPSFRLLLAIHNSVADNVVYTAVINTTGGLSNIYRSTNQGVSWTPMGVPTPNAFPGQQGIVHGAIVADPTNPNIVFLSGDRQDSPFPNANGCSNFSGAVFRGDASLLPGNPWQNIVCTGAHGTSPHADSRALVFDANGNLLQANDGGLYRLMAPDDPATRQWVSFQGNIRPTEFHSIAFDPLSHIVFGGAQDTGTSIQSSGFTWNEFLQGDGGNVAVDADLTAHPGTTIRYTSFQFFGFFNRSTWNNANMRVSGPTTVGLHITSGPGTGQTLFQFDPNIQFYNPFVLNAIDPSRMLIGTANIYESVDKGDHLANFGFTGQFIASLAYGGRLGGVPNPDVFYVGLDGSSNQILHRVTMGGPVTILTAYPGSNVQSLVMDPQNYRRVFVVDNQSRVWGSFDEGITWQNLTVNLPSLTPDVRSIEIFNPQQTTTNQVLVAGGLGGVFHMRRPGAAGTAWIPLGTGMPHALALDVHYNAACDVLAAGLLGRGAWTISGVFRGASATNCPAVTLGVQSDDGPAPLESVPIIAPAVRVGGGQE